MTSFKKSVRQDISRSIRLAKTTQTPFKTHIESLFTPGMSWDIIQIDHIIPLRCFKICPLHIVNSLHNLRPMLSSDNLSKSASFSLCSDEVQNVIKNVPDILLYIKKPYIKAYVSIIDKL